MSDIRAITKKCAIAQKLGGRMKKLVLIEIFILIN